MNVKKLVAIVCIWIIATAGWMTLGGTLAIRTGDLGSRLTGTVSNLWGTAQTQKEPSSTAAIVKSDVTVDLHTDNRQKGLLWFSVYTVNFSGRYTLKNDGTTPRSLEITLALPDNTTEFSKQKVTVNGEPLPEWRSAVSTPTVEPGDSAEVTFAYESSGVDSWTYELPRGKMTNDLHLAMTIDNPGYDFKAGSSPASQRTMKPNVQSKYELTWEKQMVSNARDIAIEMPRKVQPGPLAARISFFAPVSLFFFFVIMVAIQIVRKFDFHPMHYLFLAAAFFAFHLLMAYMVDHFDLNLSFWVSAVVSVGLVVMYLSLVAGSGPKSAVLYAGLAQFVYLVLFSYSFFLDGWTGLTLTVGAIVTLAVLMVLTAKVKWGTTMTELESRKQKPWTLTVESTGAATALAALRHPPAASPTTEPLAFSDEPDDQGPQPPKA